LYRRSPPIYDKLDQSGELMNLLVRGAVCALSCSFMFAANSAPTIGQIHDRELSILERELVPLAEAMPADKYDFAPTQGAFKGVRTFGQQVTHVASVMYSISGVVLGEKPPADVGTGENGPDSLKGKDAIVKYLKEAFAYSHKAMKSLTDQNFAEMVPAYGNKAPRGQVASELVWHGFDHYGQAVVYARMNDIIPPASR
jgi:DinB superfamily